MALTICTFKWGTKYGAEHVRRLCSMLRRNLTITFDFLLISDDPADAALAEELGTRWAPLWDEMRDAKLCGVRLRAFGADMAEFIGPRFAWVDLDMVITGNVDHIFGRKESFVALSTPAGPLAYNGSIVIMDAGARRHVYDDWSPDSYATLPAFYESLGMRHGGQSDEGWMTFTLGTREARINGGWGQRADGVYFFRHDLYAGRQKLPHDARIVIMNGRSFDPAFPALQNRCPWIGEHWR